MKKLVWLLDAATPKNVKVTATFADIKTGCINMEQSTFQLHTSFTEMGKNLLPQPDFREITKDCLQIPSSVLGGIGSQYTQIAQQAIETVETVQSIAQGKTDYLQKSPYLLKSMQEGVAEVPYTPFSLSQYTLGNQSKPQNYVELPPAQRPIDMKQQSVQIQYDSQQYDDEYVKQQLQQNLEQTNTKSNVYKLPVTTYQFESVRGNVTVKAKYVGYTEFETTPDGKLKQMMQQNQPEIKYLMELSIEIEETHPQEQTEQKTDINDLTEWECMIKAMKGEQVIDKKYTLENLWNGNLANENLSFKEIMNMRAAVKGAFVRGVWNGLKGMWDGAVVLVTEPGKVWDAVCEGTSNFMEHPWQSTKEFASETWDNAVDATWRATPQEMSEDIGEFALDVGASVATGGSAKAIGGGLKTAANGMKKVVKKLPQYVPDAGKFGTVIAGEGIPALTPAIAGVPAVAGAEGVFLRGGIAMSKELPVMNTGRILLSGVDDGLGKGARQTLSATAKHTAGETAEEVAERAVKQTTKQTVNGVVNDATAGAPIVATVKHVAGETAEKGAKQVASETAEQTSTMIQKEASGKKGIGVETSDAVSPTKIKDVSEVAVGGAVVGGVVATGARYGPRKISDALYKKLRKHTPSHELQEMARKELPIGSDDPLLTGLKVDKPAHADHIVPVDKITRMDGFDKLSEAQQLEVLNNPKNFMASSVSANTSRQSKSFAEWEYYKPGTPEQIKVNEVLRQQLMKKEKILEGELQQQIDDFLKLGSGGQ